MIAVVTHNDALQHFAELQTAYRLALGTRAGRTVLEDLERYCRARETCGVPGDHDRTWTLIGRHETWLRIRQFLDLTPEELVLLNTRPAKGAISHATRSSDDDSSND